MYKAFMMVLAIGAFVLIDLIPLSRQKEWKVFSIYIAFMVIIFAFSILLGMEADIPSPSEPLERIISYIFGL